MMKRSKKYGKIFEQRCFQLLIEAYQTSLNEKVIQLDWNENDISYELYEKMEVNPKRVKFRIHLSPEFRISRNIAKTKGFADKLPRIDLKMAHFALEQELKCFFEAKRLKEKDSGLKRAYINEGMGRFILAKYPIGCMIGYLLEGKIDETINGINSLLTKDNKRVEILNLKPNHLLKTAYESKHKEIGILKHFIFDFTSIQN